MTFKEGDTIRMKQDCSGVKKGEVCTLKNYSKRGTDIGTLYAWNGDIDKGAFSGCLCQDK